MSNTGPLNTQLAEGAAADAFEVAAAIVTKAYEEAVPEPERLKYRTLCVRSLVYGETSLPQMRSICDELAVGKDDVIVDLGSGCGHIVQFIAAYTGCKKVVGIEFIKHRAETAQKLNDSVTREALIANKELSARELHWGDFLNEKHAKLIVEEATIIFTNNLVFEPDVMTGLEEKLKKMKNGTRIVHTADLSLNVKEINLRNVKEFGAMSRTKEMRAVEGNCSWQSKTLPFFLTTVDDTKKRQFEEDIKKSLKEKEAKVEQNRGCKRAASPEPTAPISPKRTATAVRENSAASTSARESTRASVDNFPEVQSRKRPAPSRDEDEDEAAPVPKRRMPSLVMAPTGPEIDDVQEEAIPDTAEEQRPLSVQEIDYHHQDVTPPRQLSVIEYEAEEDEAAPVPNRRMPSLVMASTGPGVDDVQEEAIPDAAEEQRPPSVQEIDYHHQDVVTPPRQLSVIEYEAEEDDYQEYALRRSSRIRKPVDRLVVGVSAPKPPKTRKGKKTRSAVQNSQKKARRRPRQTTRRTTSSNATSNSNQPRRRVLVEYHLTDGSIGSRVVAWRIAMRAAQDQSN